jgi:hypothetical protein
MADELMHALDRLPWFIRKDGKSYALVITKMHPLIWWIVYLEYKLDDKIFATSCCSLLQCANEIYAKLESEGMVTTKKRKRSVKTA